jgi:hypothetical protein
MARKMDYGDWAQVLGTFDLGSRSGAISSMLPTKVAFASKEGGEQRVRLRGFNATGSTLFDLAVNPLTPSCAPPTSERMFEEFVPVTPDLERVELFIDDKRASEYVPGSPQPKGNFGLATAAAVDGGHRIPVTSDAAPEANVSYLVQARPDGDERWHTMAAGLSQPDLASIDINQFPGASALNVRVLRTNGLETSEVFQERRDFKK